MTQTLSGVVHNGTLELLEPLQGIPEDIPLKITVEPETRHSNERFLAILRALPVDEEWAAEIEAGRNRPWRVEEF